jgi:hypothetical protein
VKDKEQKNAAATMGSNIPKTDSGNHTASLMHYGTLSVEVRSAVERNWGDGGPRAEGDVEHKGAEEGASVLRRSQQV